MKLSKRSDRLIGQGMFQIKAQAEELERQGKELIHFEIGDSCFNAPKKVKEACINAIKQNKTHYTGSKGLYELRIDSTRIIYFLFTGRRFVLVHGFTKKSKETPKRELEVARKRMKDYAGD